MYYFMPEHWGWQIRLIISAFTVRLRLLAQLTSEAVATHGNCSGQRAVRQIVTLQIEST
jgi:hypothetical protein